jgi:hypothetical protein
MIIIFLHNSEMEDECVALFYEISMKSWSQPIEERNSSELKYYFTRFCFPKRKKKSMNSQLGS